MPKGHRPKQPLRADLTFPASLRSSLVENPWKFLCFVLAAAAIIQAWENGGQVASNWAPGMTLLASSQVR